MLDRLEAADRPAELMPDLCVRHRHVQAALRSADLLRGQREHATANRLRHDLRGRTGLAHWPTRGSAEREHGLLAGHVKHLHRLTG